MTTTAVVSAPAGAHFEWEEVATKVGTLGEVPILIWDDVDKMLEYYGPQAILDMANGTSFRVAFQAIARRKRLKNESDESVMLAQLEYRPGKRGPASPRSQVTRTADKAIAAVGDASLIAALLEKISSNELSAEDIRALLK